MGKRQWVCPRCKKKVNDHPAMSRRDNKTDICDSCGTAEAIFDLKMSYMKNIEEKAEAIKKEKAWLKERNNK